MKLKNKAKRIVVSVLIACMVIGTAITASAASKTAQYAVTVADLFSAADYSARYDDLQKAFGGDADALLNHYLTYGISEGRLSTVKEIINVAAYRAAYADLDAAYGDDWNAYVNHYFTYGISEGRSSFGTFNAKAYADRYPDLKAAFGYDTLSLALHYVQFGKAEGRDVTVPRPVVHHSSSSSDESASDESASDESSSNGSTSGDVSSDTPSSNETVAVTGRVVNPETGESIANATVRATSAQASLGLVRVVGANTVVDNSESTEATETTDGTYTTTTDANGNYTFDGILPGTYTLTVSCDGYMELVIGTFVVNGGETNYVESVNLLSENADGENAVAGKVTDATTGLTLSGVSVEFRDGWNATGNVVASTVTDENGEYVLPMDRGYYTATFSVNGYISVVKNVVSVTGYDTYLQNVSISPEMTEEVEYRVVLTWGETPSDLDSHLTGPVEGDATERFHVCFYDQTYLENGEVVAELDVDDTTSYGPETVTIFKVKQDGVYRYSVHDFTNGGDTNAASLELSNSGATVNVYQGATLVRTYHVPTNVPAIVWNVFEIRNGELVTLNQMNYNYDTIYGEGYNSID